MSEEKKSALIFPAFAHEYPADPFGGIHDLEVRFNSLLDQASRDVDPGLLSLDFVSNDFLDNELRTQYVTYIYSCSLSDHFKSKGLSACYTAGYSMGIYSSLYHSGVTTFIDGLLLIRAAYLAIKKITRDRKFGMCSIIGLSRQDISELIQGHGLEVGITNQNSEYAFVLSGTQKDILTLTELSKAEGALHTHLLKVMLPYHSTLLNATGENFREFIGTIPFNSSSARIISLRDQRLMEHPDDLKEEVISNLFTPLNWYLTQLALEKLGVNVFIETGFGNGLAKNSKFIEGNYKFHTAMGYLKNI